MRSNSLLALRPTSALHTPLRPQHALGALTHQRSQPQSRPQPHPRTFSTSLNPPQTLTATRILPYPASALFDLIADIPSYPSFLPYCTSSTITAHSSPDATHKKRWPAAADLRVGWGSYSETFRSRVFCKPYTILEAVAGNATSSLSKDSIPHYYDSAPTEESGQGEENPLFTSLLTRWTLNEFPFKSPPSDGKKIHDAGKEEESAPRTEVTLVIEAQFASAVYAALSQAAAPKVAGMMVEAFERRAREMLGEGRASGREGVERSEKGSERRSGEGGSTLEGVVSSKEGP